MKRYVLVISLIALGIVLGFIGSQVLEAQQALPKIQTLLTTDLTGIEGREGVLYIARIQPGEVAGKHYHSGYQFSYVLEGSIIMNMEGKAPVTYNPGDAFFIPPKQVHWPQNDGTVPAKILSFWIKEKGEPASTPVK